MAQLGKQLWGTSKRRVLIGSGVGLVLTILAVVALLPNDAPLTNCDKYAASDLDPQHKTRGVQYEKINPALAIPACEWALIQYPNSSRLIYQLGRAHAKNANYSAALVQFRKAADQGYASAQYNLGVMYERAEGVKNDDARAVVWYRKAAEQGYAFAQSNLGNMYLTGRGVPRDFPEASKWLHKAADQGNTRASIILGLMYAVGQGVARDYVEAVKWFRVAADQGEPEAQRLLGMMYEHGSGVSKNLAEAAEWYRKAAAQDDTQAQSKLAALDELEKGRTQEVATQAAQQAANQVRAREPRAASPPVGPSEPYAAGQKALSKELYYKGRLVLLDEVRTAYFAAGCKVIAEVSAFMIGQTEASLLFLETTGMPANTFDEDIDSLFRVAASEGQAKAQQPGACDYWQQHPQAVAEIRRRALLATSHD